MCIKAKVFVITPFGEDFLALYNELKNTFSSDFEFTNAGDLDNQRNILQDIVVGIYEAKVVIADLTGMNPNVFYELGLAHAMNKKVIIITQGIDELPFDIKSYRANEYSLQFNKLPNLINELRKLLSGAVDDNIKYGNPVADYIPDFFKDRILPIKNEFSTTQSEFNDVKIDDEGDEEGENGFLDFVADINEHSELMSTEIVTISDEMQEMTSSITEASTDIDRVKFQSGHADASYVRNVCRRLAEPVDKFAGRLNDHINSITDHWYIIENSFLSLLDSPYGKTDGNRDNLEVALKSLSGMQIALRGTDEKIVNFISALGMSRGIERRLSKAITGLIDELQKYLSMTETMSSSIDRIIAKGGVVLSLE